MKSRASRAASPERRWAASLRTGSRRACFCSWVGKCIGAPQLRYSTRATIPPRREYPMLRAIQAALLAAAALALASPAMAQDTLKKIKETGTITVGHRDASIPFSYYDDQQKPVGYAMDICMAIVDAVKKNLNMPNLKVNYQLVTSANRIPLISNGTVDLECGSTT